jgi:hypothetical protein
MLGREVFDDVGARLTADLRLGYPAAEARFVRSGNGWLLELREGPHTWGAIGTWVAEDDVLGVHDAERITADLVEDAVNNLWPDEDVEPWPACPAHPDHPLQFGIVGGRASWYCSQEAGPSCPLGSLEGMLQQRAPNHAD